ncbi:MAG TPA: SDR family NAD(P)-dependent oxidoreductase, partial [Mycobacterium sp.]|nr:SDR family NAD(P)-dependent oxidoreductase [Mycobacterium sp.]
MTTNGPGLVIVTGASSGIGEAIALHLREGGFSVLAGVRRDEDAERLSTRGLTPIHLDVTDPEQLAAARAEVGDRPLAGLVNNA